MPSLWWGSGVVPHLPRSVTGKTIKPPPSLKSWKKKHCCSNGKLVRSVISCKKGFQPWSGFNFQAFISLDGLGFTLTPVVCSLMVVANVSLSAVVPSQWSIAEHLQGFFSSVQWLGFQIKPFWNTVISELTDVFQRTEKGRCFQCHKLMTCCGENQLILLNVSRFKIGWLLRTKFRSLAFCCNMFKVRRLQDHVKTGREHFYMCSLVIITEHFSFSHAVSHSVPILAPVFVQFLLLYWFKVNLLWKAWYWY